MLHIARLILSDFKNYHDATLEFSDGVNLFTGDNGSGKTNLLDAVYYLSMTRSFLNAGDALCIRQGATQAIIRGEFRNDGDPFTIACTVRQGQKKIFRRNQQDYERLSDHIGCVPVVMIAPTDQELITDGSEVRRRFIDSVISQYDRKYLDDLIRYNQVLVQRNSLLRKYLVQDWNSFGIWDEQLIVLGTSINAKRSAFVEGFRQLFTNIYKHITAAGDQVQLDYESRLNETGMEELLINSRTKDAEMQFTTAGIHKDDLGIIMDGRPAKKIASQGQQKSIVIALKLAHYEYLREKNKAKPILLLDDIFDKLDDKRVARLMELVSGGTFGQLFITDTHPERVSSIFNGISVPVRVFVVENGLISEPYAGMIK